MPKKGKTLNHAQQTGVAKEEKEDLKLKDQNSRTGGSQRKGLGRYILELYDSQYQKLLYFHFHNQHISHQVLFLDFGYHKLINFLLNHVYSMDNFPIHCD